MDDDKIKEIFSNFEPELSSDSLFMSELRQKMEAVEIVRRHNAEFRSRSRKAVVAASLAGFAAGFIFSQALPYISRALAALLTSVSDNSVMQLIIANSQTIAWLAVGAASAFTALNAYSLSLALLKPHRRG